MAGNSGMQVGEGALQQAANTISEAQGSLQARLKRLEGDLANVGAVWQGPAAQRFGQLMQQWRENADKTTNALSEFIEKLGGASRAYSQQEEDLAADMGKYTSAL